MIFKRLLGRKRARTPAASNRDEPLRIVLARPARGDRRRIETLSELRELLSSDSQAERRAGARERYVALLCGREDAGPELGERLQEIAGVADQGILERIALGAQEGELRGAAISRVSSQTVLRDCALEDALAGNRRAAVERLEDKQALEQVAKSIGKRDKGVYRAARQKLREIAEREALPERIRAECVELIEKLERLGRFGQWERDRAVLDLLDRQWTRVEPMADPAHGTRYRELRGRFLSAFEAYSREHEAAVAAEESRKSLRERRHELLEELRTLSSLGDPATMAESLERIAAGWNALGTLPEPEQRSLAREYAAVREQIEGRMEDLAAIAERNSHLRTLLARAEELLARSGPLDRKQVRAVREQAKPLVEAKGVDKAVAARFAEARDTLDERLRRQKKHAEQRLEQLAAKLDELEGAIEGGRLKEAEPLYQSICAGLELVEHSGLPDKEYAQRLRALAPRLRDLQRWRKWGTDQHRQELCAAMEALVSEDMRLDAVALGLHDLQMEWKGLDKGGSRVNHPLWDRFHAASERVYERCKPYLEEQAAAREANREERERLCTDLEAFLDQADWERMDWKKAARAQREMRQAWAGIGAVDGRHRKALEKRFREAMKRLEDRLAEERGRNQAHKRELIAKIEALADEPDLGRAIEETKRLQQQWHTTVPARQKEENRLWQRYRAACDLLFERRKARQDTEAAEHVENLRHRQSLCAEAEELAASGAKPDALDRGLRELDRRWGDARALAVPRQAEADLSQRWRRARGLVEDRRREGLEDQRRADLALLAHRAALCERLERTAASEAGPASAADIEADWQRLPAQRDPAVQAAIEKRFARAMQALRQGGEGLQQMRSAFVANGERRAELCLHLEILARIESPPDLADERLQFQVERLTEHMREGEKDPLEATSRLLQQWYLCGPAPEADAPALEERFHRARRAIEEAERDNEAA